MIFDQTMTLLPKKKIGVHWEKQSPRFKLNQIEDYALKNNVS